MAGFVDLDPGDPLDPIEAAIVGGDEAERGAIGVGQGLVGDAGGQEAAAGDGQGEATAIAGDRFDGEALSGWLEAGQVEQAGQGQAAPMLLGVEAAGAIEQGAPGVVSELVEVGVGQAQGALDGPGDDQAPGRLVKRPGVVEEPTCGREATREAADLIGAGEAAQGAGQVGQGFGRFGDLAQGQAGQAQAAQVEEGAPAAGLRDAPDVPLGDGVPG